MNESNPTYDLSMVPLLQGVPQEILDKLTDKVVPVHLAPEEALFNQGDPGDALYIIKRGRVKIVAGGIHDQDLILNTYGSGEIVGEMSMIDQKPRSAGVVATEPTDLLQLKREDFLAIATHQPALALRVMSNLSGRLRFSAAYLQQAVAWSEKIATGNYDSAINEISGAQSNPTPDADRNFDRADEFLGAFFKMVQDVKSREEGLRQQLNAFRVHIDQAKKREEVQDLVESDFFKRLEALSQRTDRAAAR